MSEDIKLKFEDFEKIHLGFPSIWKGKSTNEDLILIHFRYGYVTIYLCEEKENLEILRKHLMNSNKEKVLGVSVILKEPKDEFSLDGFLSDDDLLIVLEKNGLVYYDDEN